MINLLLAIDPLPVAVESDSWKRLLKLCRKILDECVENIITHFPPQDDSKFVNERFYADWTVDHEWGWQQNRGIVGHNLKISWNLTRCGHYYAYLAEQARNEGDDARRRKCLGMSKRCYEVAQKLGKNMEEVGVDLIRGGIYDALERNPANGMPTEFAWESTKDFWQQEQAILAYYILSGIPNEHQTEEDGRRFLELARYCTMFWNVFFIDQENGKIYFRTTESGAPVVQDGYGLQGGHAIAGYHSFELNYLAHLYIRAYIAKSAGQDESFCLSFRPRNCEGVKTFNVLPDFFRPGDLKIIGVKFNGTPQSIRDSSRFQIDIENIKPGTKIEVEFMPIRRETASEELRIQKEREGVVEMAYDTAG